MTFSIIEYEEGAFLAVTDGTSLGGLFVNPDGLNFDNYLGRDRMTWAWRVMNETGCELGSGNDLHSPPHATPVDMMGTLVSFLLACVESPASGENYDLFVPVVREWAEMWKSELEEFAMRNEVPSENQFAASPCGHNVFGPHQRCANSTCPNFYKGEY